MIPLGYEIGSGQRVKIPLNHMAILGQTQLSGKTTTMEAVALRGDVKAISFITKPGEKSFRLRTPIPAFFSETTVEEYWKHVVAMLEYGSGVRLGWRERGVVIKLCQEYKKAGSRVGVSEKGKSKRESFKYSWKAPRTLAAFMENVDTYQQYARSSEEMICIQLREFLRPAILEIERTEFSDKLQLARGINVMDITDLSDGLKSLVIRSVIEWVHKHGRKIVVIIPEAWKFIPEGRSTPVKLALEGLIREGAGIGNFVWMDSQDLRGVDKMLLRSVIVWLFGVQRQKNEVANTLASIPDHPKPSATEIMQLGKGEFFVAYGNTLVHTYVQPAGMADEHAQAIARGEERPESWMQIARSLDAEEKESQPNLGGGKSESDDRSAEPESDAGMASIPENESTSGELRASMAGMEGTEEMWKEKYDALKLEFDQLREAHDAIAEKLEDLLHSRSPSKEPVARSAGTEAGATVIAPASVDNPANTSNGKHDLESVYRYIIGRAAKEQEPVLLSLLIERPELMINIQRKKIEMAASSLKGALAILISEKFFDGVREFTDARKELIRRGFLGNKAPNLQISQALQGLVEFGFLTKEEQGYQAVAGMKVNIVEARA